MRYTQTIRGSVIQTMNNLIFRTAAIIFHALLNVFIVSYLTGYDITGSWFRFIGFLLVLFFLLFFFIRHILSYIHFIKSTSV
jgi:LPXTG-motif cell wall-anchored protein